MRALFEGRTLLIATKHQKEQALAPILEKELGVKVRVPEQFDTDVFGTFTGEVERIYDPLETARRKCLAAMEQFDCDLAIASEGSFGLHPTMIFVPADSEILLLIDKKNQLELVVREISTDTNFDGEEIKSMAELDAFALKAKFPSHALILRNSRHSLSPIYKGLQDWTELKQTANYLLQTNGGLYAETDMRAMYNPTRMKVIEKCVYRLLDKLKSGCPQCHTPGFAVTAAKSGLPCGNCHAPTRSTLKHVLECKHCGYQEEKLHPYAKQEEDPMYCDVCNP